MKQTAIKQETGTTALVYCRVSSVKQRLDGTGLESQEHRCRQHALMKGCSAP